MAPEKANAHVPVLDLEDLVPERPRIKFPGGRLYELIHHNELGIRTLKEIQKRWESVGDMLTRGEGTDLTEDEAAEISAAMDSLVRILVPSAPADAVDALTDTHKMAIVEHFYRTVPSAPPGTSDDAAPLATSESS